MKMGVGEPFGGLNIATGTGACSSSWGFSGSISFSSVAGYIVWLNGFFIVSWIVLWLCRLFGLHTGFIVG